MLNFIGVGGGDTHMVHNFVESAIILFSDLFIQLMHVW